MVQEWIDGWMRPAASATAPTELGSWTVWVDEAGPRPHAVQELAELVGAIAPPVGSERPWCIRRGLPGPGARALTRRLRALGADARATQEGSTDAVLLD